MSTKNNIISQRDEREQFKHDVLTGLADEQPGIPSKYLYDELGSALFEAITVTPEYYVTRADLTIMDQCLTNIAHVIGPDAHVIEFGSGAGVKTQRLLTSLENPAAYSPLEISATALEASAASLRNAFPNILISPVQADYTQTIAPAELDICPDCRTRVIYFPGSTIGNFEHEQAQSFLERFYTIVCAYAPKIDGGVLIGIDLLKDIDTLIAAYDDEAGVTSAFNKNLLTRINSTLAGNFDLSQWIHEARFNHELERIEMHLVSITDQTVSIHGQQFDFPAGKTIHTENSHKYSLARFSQMAQKAGFYLDQHWTDPEDLFATCYLRPAKQPNQPG